jgi:segregation and condensation protein B
VGRPALFATTRQFLDDLGLQSLDQLPALDGASSENSLIEQIEFGLSEPSLPLESAALTTEVAPVSTVPMAAELDLQVLPHHPEDARPAP